MTSEPQFVASLLHDLCRASRPAGSARNAAVASELAGHFRAFGYDVRLDRSTFTGWELTSPPRVRLLTPEARELAGCLPVVWSGSTETPVVGRIMPGAGGIPRVLTTFGAYPWNCLPVVEDGAAGPAACLLTGPRVWAQPRDDPSDPLPFVMIGPADGECLLDHLSRQADVRVEVQVGSRYVPGSTLTNLIATDPTRASGDGQDIVIVAAHYDSFFTTVGAHDNASGAAALLCLARRVARERGGTSVPPPPRTRPPAKQFVCFDAEEWNKLGSERYVATLEREGRLSKIKAMINIDSVGVGDGIYFSASPPHAASVAAALRAMAGGAGGGEATEVLSRRRVRVTADEGPSPFDSWSFAHKGIPAVQVGSFGDTLFPHWHAPGDNLAGIGRDGIELIRDVATLVHGLLRVWKWAAP